MAAWLVTEDPDQFVRVDTIAHVNPLAVFPEGDPRQWETPPKSRFRAADHAQIIVSTVGGQQFCALSCPGYAAWDAVTQLLYVLADLCGKHDLASGPVFVYGPRGSRARWSGDLWQVSKQLPKADYPPSW
ncbi:hypothetical protein [Nonomuraea sp. NPDC050202]|uniref:hypothetical protein n=1 Tax=Nonomuraea sp. NPDC050202 TaxID=3155035 RepID=UPI0033C20501